MESYFRDVGLEPGEQREYRTLAACGESRKYRKTIPRGLKPAFVLLHLRHDESRALSKRDFYHKLLKFGQHKQGHFGSRGQVARNMWPWLYFTETVDFGSRQAKKVKNIM